MKSGRLLLLLSVNVVVYVLALEILLQAGAWFVRATGRELPGQWLTSHRRILCLGDSNTYGLWLERDEAYPQQLESLWNRDFGEPRIEVLNLGFPGTNSSRLRRDLPRMLEVFEPDLVILKIGANDFWTKPVPYGSEEPGVEARSLFERFERHLLVLKLYDMVRRARDARRLAVAFEGIAPPIGDGPHTRREQRGGPQAADPPPAVRRGTATFGSETFDLGFESGQPGARPAQKLEENVEQIVRMVQESGARIVLMTYASHLPVYRVASRVARRVAAASQAELIDNTKAFAALCPEFECPEYLFPDQHPNANGYRVIAQAIARHLAAAPL